MCTVVTIIFHFPRLRLYHVSLCQNFLFIVLYRYLARLTPNHSVEWFRPRVTQSPKSRELISEARLGAEAGLTAGDMAQKCTERVSYGHTRSIFNLQFCHNNRVSWKRLA